MGIQLTAGEVAELEGLKHNSVLRRINRNKLKAVKETDQQKGVFEYRIALSDLSAKAQARYNRAQVKHEPKPMLAARLQEKELNELTGKQREQVAHWRRVLDEWQQHTAEYPKRKTEQTKVFIEQYNRWNPQLLLSERTLYLKWKLFREFGEVALADGRADRADKGTTNISEIAWSVFLQWWLDEGCPTVMHCHNLLMKWAEMDMPELLPLPAVDSFYRETKKIPKAVIDFFRYGKKRFEDESLPFLQRWYEFMDSNDVWVADYHTLDFFVRDDFTQKVFRPHLIVWQDIRSRKMLALHICESSNSDGVIICFRKAVEKYGIPRSVYLDNGREFLVGDFGGRGKRKTSDKTDRGTTILERMQVEMVNAKVANGKAKVIERAFRVLTEQFSKLINTYTGGRPEWKPERLEGILKKDKNIPLLSEIREKLELYIEGWYNMKESKAFGLNGLSPNNCYDQNLLTKRVATEAQLNLMLLRSAKSQLVDRDGVYLKFGDIKLWFYHEELIFHYLKHPVYVRYNPENLSSVHIYNEDEKFITIAQRIENGGYDVENDLESIKKIESIKKKQRDNVNGYMKEIAASIQAPSAMDVMMRAAQANIESELDREYHAAVLEPIRMDRPIAIAVGAENEDNLIDITRMIENAKKSKGD